MRIRDNGYVYYDERPRLGQRIGRFVALLGVVFAVTMAVVVIQRLSDDTLALIIGLLLAGVPLLLIIGLLVSVLGRRQHQQSPQQMTIPPIVVQLPQQPQPPALPDYGLPWEGTSQRAGGRQWEVIGEE